MALISAHLQAQGNMEFESNSAMFGGGLAMEDRCLVGCSLATATCCIHVSLHFKLTLSHAVACFL